MMSVMNERPEIDPSAVRRLRFKNRMTQQELAQNADLSIGQINRIESGKIRSPQFKTVDRLAAALHVDSGELFKENGES